MIPVESTLRAEVGLVKFGNVRLMYGDLFNPKITKFQNEQANQVPKYRACCAFPKIPNPQLPVWVEYMGKIHTPQQGAQVQLAHEFMMWLKGDLLKRVMGDKAATYSLGSNQFSYIDGDGEGKNNERLRGHYYINGTNEGAPSIVDKDKATLTIASKRPYMGCYVNVIYRFWAVAPRQKNGANLPAGVFAEFQGLQFECDGEAFMRSAAEASDWQDTRSPEERASGSQFDSGGGFGGNQTGSQTESGGFTPPPGGGTGNPADGFLGG